MSDYNFQNDWRMIKAKKEIPDEIISFMDDVFLITEIRERLAIVHGVKFEVRSREQNHSIPHIHASYDNYEISIAIPDGSVLAGNLPTKQQRIAVDWVRAHADELLGKWSSFAMSATSIMTKSRIG